MAHNESKLFAGKGPINVSFDIGLDGTISVEVGHGSVDKRAMPGKDVIDAANRS